MRRPCIPAAAVALLAALPALAEPEPAEIDRFVAAVRAIGCQVVSDADAMAVEQATGFGEAKLAEIVAVLLTRGDAIVPPSEEGLRLTVEGCR
jgi:hypothetical protein